MSPPHISQHLSLAVLAFLLGMIPSWSGQTREGARRPTPRPPAGRPATPLTLSDVEEGLDNIRGGAASLEQSLIRLIEKNGISFRASEDVIAGLRRLGASEQLVAVIRRIAPPEQEPTTPEPAPLPTPPKRTGALSLQCVPMECEIEIDRQPAGSTSQGSLFKDGLNPGPAGITVKKAGYITEQRAVEIAADSQSRLRFVLKPDAGTQAAFGDKLAGAMLRAIGYTSNAARFEGYGGAGSATVFLDGNKTEWLFEFVSRKSGAMQLQLSGSLDTITLECEGERCIERRKKGWLPGFGRSKAAAIEQVQVMLRAFFRYSLTSALEQIIASRIKCSANRDLPEAGGQEHLLVETRDSLFDLTVHSDLLVDSITCRSKAGLGPEVVITYANYSDVGGFKYPNRTVIRTSNNGRDGIEVRLDGITAQDSRPRRSTAQ